MGYTSDTTVAEVAALLDEQRGELLAAVGTDPATWATPSCARGGPYGTWKLAMTFSASVLRSRRLAVPA